MRQPATGSIGQLLIRCVEQGPRQRLRDIGEARLEIDRAIARGSGERRAGEFLAGPPRTAGATRGQKIAWTAGDPRTGMQSSS